MGLEQRSIYPNNLDNPSHHSSIGAGVVLPLLLPGTISDAQEILFVAPWDILVRKVSTIADGVTNPGDGDVTVDVQDDGVSILTSALSIAAAETEVSEDSLDHVIEQGSEVKIVFALTGTGPALNDVGVVLS